MLGVNKFCVLFKNLAFLPYQEHSLVSNAWQPVFFLQLIDYLACMPHSLHEKSIIPTWNLFKFCPLNPYSFDWIKKLSKTLIAQSPSFLIKAKSKCKSPSIFSNYSIRDIYINYNAKSPREPVRTLSSIPSGMFSITWKSYNLSLQLASATLKKSLSYRWLDPSWWWAPKTVHSKEGRSPF